MGNGKLRFVSVEGKVSGNGNKRFPWEDNVDGKLLSAGNGIGKKLLLSDGEDKKLLDDDVDKKLLDDDVDKKLLDDDVDKKLLGDVVKKLLLGGGDKKLLDDVDRKLLDDADKKVLGDVDEKLFVDDTGGETHSDKIGQRPKIPSHFVPRERSMIFRIHVFHAWLISRLCNLN
ncbi:11886_t:CDS:2 [Acaulospora colombiana]|uniref:11886_t:CDS:1 n=1 Tax=Acaulospora colombiana TaxID=27376 RepID=A0ACA9KXF9_9GLOM|nr:11886_t:CDS:2 [Acaulospora colombiana]